MQSAGQLLGVGQLGDAEGALKITSAGAGLVATAAGAYVTATGATAASLIAAGGAASVVPVVGWIAGAVVALTGLVLKLVGGKKQAKAMSEQADQYYEAIALQKSLNAEADENINKFQSQIQYAKEELAKYGVIAQLSGPRGLGWTWFNETFLPVKTAEKELTAATDAYNKTFPQLQTEGQQKIDQLKAMAAELTALQNKITNTVSNTDLLKMVGGVLGGILVLVGIGKLIKK